MRAKSQSVISDTREEPPFDAASSGIMSPGKAKGMRKRSVRLSTEIDVQQYAPDPREHAGEDVDDYSPEKAPDSPPYDPSDPNAAAHDAFLKAIMAHGKFKKKAPKLVQLKSKSISTELAKADFAERL